MPESWKDSYKERYCLVTKQECTIFRRKNFDLTILFVLHILSHGNGKGHLGVGYM